MAVQGTLALPFVLCLVILHEGLHRHLRIDDHITAVGEVEDDVRNHLLASFLAHHTAVGVAQHHLFLVLHPSLETHVLEQGVQPQLTEIALCLVLGSEGLRQAVGTLAHLTGLFEIGLDRRIEALHGGGMLTVALLHCLTHLLQLLLQRRQDGGELTAVGCRQLIGPLLQDFFRDSIDLLTDECRLVVHLLLLHLPHLRELLLVGLAEFFLLFLTLLLLTTELRLKLRPDLVFLVLHKGSLLVEPAFQFLGLRLEHVAAGEECRTLLGRRILGIEETHGDSQCKTSQDGYHDIECHFARVLLVFSEIRTWSLSNHAANITIWRDKTKR